MEQGNELNELQKEAYDSVINGNNVFITGAGGCGKSFLIKKIYKDLGLTKNVALTSLTGISSEIIGGQTLHSYLGIKLGTGSFEKIYKMISECSSIKYRWKRLDILIVDEISMLSLELFEKLERLARELRGNASPFGGIQLVFSGDFLQLPTVLNNFFCFESNLWNICIKKTIYLTQIIRQKDLLFSNILNKVRIGQLDNDCKKILSLRELKYISDNGLIPTMIYSTNDKVDKMNKKYYDKLDSKEYCYNINFVFKCKIYNKEKYEKLSRFPTEIKLKVGAQVIFLINKDSLVNGSRGVITKFIEGYPVVLFQNGMEIVVYREVLDIEEGDKTIVQYSQIPLKLAWAITCHKSQGCTLDLVCINMKNFFEYGQVYVALSRVKDLNCLYIKNLNYDLIKTNPKALEFYNKLI